MENPEIQNQIARFIHIWVSGGWTMIPLLIVAVAIYTSATGMILWFRRRGFKKVSEPVWREWVDNPETGQGEVGEIIRYANDEVRSANEIQDRFTEIVGAKLPRVDRQLNFLTVLVNSAPLLGLLGTVLGMLATFHGISMGGGKAMDVIAAGISEALITTEMGLLIAIPGYVFCSRIKRHREEYEAFLASLESASVQTFKRRQLNIRKPAEQPASADSESFGLDESLAPA